MNRLSWLLGGVVMVGMALAASSAEAQWVTRYRVTSSYSLPSVPYQFNPVVVPVVQPTTTFAPVIVNQPTVVARPVIASQPVVVGRPVIAAQPIIAAQPVISQPVVVARPVVVGQPVVAAPVVVRRGLFRRPVIVAPAAPAVVQPAVFVP